MRFLPLLASLFLLGLPLSGAAGDDRAFSVNVESDGLDFNPGDGACDSDTETAGDQCTLRAAVMESNAVLGTDTITLPAGVFSLSLKNSGFDAEDATAGDLDVTDDLVVQGSGQPNTVISGKKAKDRIFDAFADLEIMDLTLTGGSASSKNDDDILPGGGGCVRGRAVLTLDTVLVVKCKAEDDGGGLDLLSGTLSIIDSAFVKNSAKQDGGGVQVEPANTTIEGSLFLSNKSKDEAGGFGIDGGFATVTNSTFSGNKAKAEGGGILNEEGGTLELVHVTFANNKAKQGESIHVNDTLNPPSTTATNTIFFSKKKGGANSCRQSQATAIVSGGGNVDNGSSCGLDDPSDLSDTDPLLAKKVEDNGGPTPTHALETDSPAVDITDQNCEAVDQRGVSRDTDCDAGAFELTAP